MFMLLMCPQQKNNARMEEITQKFSEPGDLVVDAGAGTVFFAKDGMLHTKHRRFIRCEGDPSCVIEAISQLILLYAR